MEVAEMEAAANKHRWLVLASVSLGTFMSAVNSSIVNVALPTIAEEFGLDLQIIQWVVLIYLLVISSVLPVVGRLADVLGRKLIYCGGFLIVMVGAVVSALVDSFFLLIMARMIMALGAAMLMANGMAIITLVFPAEERGRALGIANSTVAIGLLSGPVLGGLLVSLAGWHAVFWVNLPLGLIAFLTAWHVLPQDKPASQEEPFDYLGSILFITGMVSLLLLVTRVQAWGLMSPVTLIMVIITMGLFVAFWLTERKTIFPLVDFELFKIRPFSVGVSAAFLFFMAIAAVSILTPFYLQDMLGYPPNKVGVYILPFPLAMSIVAPLSGYLSDRMSPMFLTTGGLLCSAVGLGWLAFIQPEHGNGLLLACFTLIGIGMGLFQSPNNSTIMGSVPRTMLGLAGGFNALVRNLGQVIGTAVMVGVFTAVSNSYLAQNFQETQVEALAFMTGWRVALLLAAGLTIVGAIISSRRS